MKAELKPESLQVALLRVRLTPRGGRNALMKIENGVLFARVAAPPVDGAANKALIALLSGALNIPKSALSFQSGETGRDKCLRVEGVEEAALTLRLHNVVET
jgi:uncharacterized protein YggU (UPF0235/DUF167 family)